jgi:hypothetical protein
MMTTPQVGRVTLMVPDVLPDQFSPQQIRIAADYDPAKD